MGLQTRFPARSDSRSSVGTNGAAVLELFQLVAVVGLEAFLLDDAVVFGESVGIRLACHSFLKPSHTGTKSNETHSTETAVVLSTAASKCLTECEINSLRL